MTETGIVATNLVDNTDETIEADYVVLSVGNRKDTATIDEFQKAFNRVIPLGQTHKTQEELPRHLLKRI